MKKRNKYITRAGLLGVFLLLFILISCVSAPQEEGGAGSAIVKAETGAAAVEAEPFAIAEPLPLDASIIFGRLENGLTYYVRNNKTPEKRAELRLVVNAGSVLEDEDQRGLAHFVEHMAFKGTKNFARQEIIDYLESIGMRFGPDLNAYTSFDETVYRLQVPTDQEEILTNALLILRDWASDISFDDEEVESERGVIIEEWRLGRGADARMSDIQVPYLYKGSRYAERRPIGKIEIIENCESETLKRFYHDWYRPDLMAVVAVGDFDAAEMVERIKEIFSSFQNPVPLSERIVYPLPDHDETLFAIASDVEATSSGVTLITKFDPQPLVTVGDYRQLLVEALYHGMFNKRLYELTRKADPQFLSGYSGQARLVRAKEFYVLGARVKDGGIEQGLEALLSEAERVSRYGFTDSELEREKMEILKHIEQIFNERDKIESDSFTAEYVNHFLENEATPGIAYEYELYNKFIPEISLAEINRLSGEWLTEKNRVILVNSPEKPGLAIPGQQQLAAIFKMVKAMEISPYQDTVQDKPLIPVMPGGGSIVYEKRIENIGVTEWGLSNGVRVILRPTDFKNNQILCGAYSPGGHSLYADSDYVAAVTASALVREGGIGGFNAIELQKKLSGKMAEVSPWIGELFEGLAGSATPEDLETMFQLIYLYFTSPRMDESAYSAYKARVEAFFENRSSSPEAVFWDMVTETLTQDHLRGRPWKKETLAAMDLESSFAVYQDRFADAGDFTFILVGSFEPDKVRTLVERYLGNLPSAGREESWKDLGIDPPQGVVERTVRRGVEEKSRVQIIFNGNFLWSRKNIFLLKALAEIVDIRLRESLREEQGGVYSIGVSESGSHYPDQEYFVYIGFGSSPGQVEKLSNLVFSEISLLQSEGPAQGSVDKVIEILKRERETNMRENEFWLNVLRSYYMNKLDPQLILAHDQLIDTLSPAVIQEAARVFLKRDRYVRVILLPEG